jgi:hypothetical protein
MSWPSIHVNSEPASLGDALLRELNAFRLSVMRLKPSTDPALDFEAFARVCRGSSHVAFLRDAAGAVCGSFIATCWGGEVGGRRYRATILDYGFVRSDLRGHPAYVAALFPIMVRETSRWRGEEMWAGGIGYPTSLLALGRVMPTCYLQGDPEIPPVARAILHHLVEEAGARWEPERCRVNMPTIPPEMPARWYTHAEREPLYGRILERCPEWKEGYGLAFVTRIQMRRVFADVGLKVLRRVVRWQP